MKMAAVALVTLALVACRHKDEGTPEVRGPGSAVRAGVHETKCGIKNEKDDAKGEARDPKCD